MTRELSITFIRHYVEITWQVRLGEAMARTSGVDLLQLHLVVLRGQAGDEQAFAQLFDWFGERTLHYLRSLVGEAAEDVQQEVWLSVYRGLATLADPGVFRTWLFRTTRHRAIDYLRKKKREREIEDELAAETHYSSEQNDTSTYDVDPAQIDMMLQELSPTHREVLILKYRDDLSYAELARVIGCSIGTVRSRLHHAKRRLQDLIELRQQSTTSEGA
ncbi:MAG: RNA polymerase sigma factor [Gemmatimonadota bacterium]